MLWFPLSHVAVYVSEANCVAPIAFFSAAGDVAGIGWERTEGTPPPPGQPAKGRVYFTYCGQRLSPYLEDVSGGMWPVVHIQKKASYCWKGGPA